LREWRESAFYWQKHADTIRTMFGPITRALIEDAEIVEGDAVLDVAGGAGEPSLTIAKTVGPTGSVTCTDVTAEMVAAAQSEAQRHGVTNISFKQCAADSLPFENNSFDAVVCRLGIMFFPDPVAGLREMLRVAKREGILSLVVWDKGELNPFSYLITDVLARHFGAPAPADPNAPGAFRFAEHGSLARILIDAGAADVEERVLKFQIRSANLAGAILGASFRDFGDAARKVGHSAGQQRNLIAQEAQEAVRQYFSSGQLSVPAQMIIVTGRRR
jgi:ubiquinone/menaquinone biosynthesis C-methylase UbiE